MRTTAVYDPQAKQFVLHTQDFQAAKCWIGNLGELHLSVNVRFIYTQQIRYTKLHALLGPTILQGVL